MMKSPDGGAALSSAPAPGGDRGFPGALALRGRKAGSPALKLGWVAEHGETARDRAGKVHAAAHRDEPLDAIGRQQAVMLGVRLRRMGPRGPSVIYHSPAQRACQTARIAAAVAGREAREAPQLDSLQIGRLALAAGGNQKEVARKLAPYFAHPKRVLPGGESVAGWKSRVKNFMLLAARQARSVGEPPPLFVTHSNVVGLATGRDPGATMAVPPRPAEPVEIQFKEEKWPGRGM